MGKRQRRRNREARQERASYLVEAEYYVAVAELDLAEAQADRWRSERDGLAAELHQRGEASWRQLAKVAGVSHVALVKSVQRTRAKNGEADG